MLQNLLSEQEGKEFQKKISWSNTQVNTIEMSVTVKINRFHLPKAKANLIGRIEFRGEYFESAFSFYDLEVINP